MDMFYDFFMAISQYFYWSGSNDLENIEEMYYNDTPDEENVLGEIIQMND